MKCRIPTMQDIANDAAIKAIERSRAEREAIFQDATQKAVPYVIAYCLRTLETKYGFRGKRLNDFVESIGQVVKASIADEDMTAYEIIDHMKTAYEIDIIEKKVV